MRTWDDYKEHIKNSSPDGAEEIAEIEALSKNISSVNRANYKHILEGVQQLEAGHTHLVSSKELEELMNE